TQSDPVIAADLILRDPLASWIAEVTRTRALREGAHGEA
ncbi:MAG: hypothetical protein QG597_5117, partial [Actinomycetota bacterium]|nr:hypothetical protein [Actinomycetota bacterium]